MAQAEGGRSAAGLTPIEEILAVDEPEEPESQPLLGEEDPEEPPDDEDQAPSDGADDAGEARSRGDTGSVRRAGLWRLVARGVMDPAERRFRKRSRIACPPSLTLG